MLIYIAGLYTKGDIDANISAARKVAIEVWESGNWALCPHLNTAHFEQDCRASYEDYMAGDLRMIATCDAILMLPSWQESNGAKIEHEYAKSIGLPIYYYPDQTALQRHPTEIRAPQQARAFLETVMQMYRVHLDKNADYSPANIMGAGEIGVMTRLWDKIARLMNLTGFRFVIAEPATFASPSAPKNESIEDNLIDAAVYPIIWKLLRRGVWGK